MHSITRSQAIRRHRKLWRWLAENPTKRKYDWPGWKENGGKYEYVRNHCFLCSYTKGDCKSCPLVWEQVVCMCESAPHSYTEYVMAGSNEKRTEIALFIANLPVKRRK